MKYLPLTQMQRTFLSTKMELVLHIYRYIQNKEINFFDPVSWYKFNTLFLIKGVTYRSAVGDNCMRSFDSAGYLWYDTNCDEDHQVLCEYDCGNVNNINVIRNCKHRLY